MTIGYRLSVSLGTLTPFIPSRSFPLYNIEEVSKSILGDCPGVRMESADGMIMATPWVVAALETKPAENVADLAESLRLRLEARGIEWRSWKIIYPNALPEVVHAQA